MMLLISFLPEGLRFSSFSTRYVTQLHQKGEPSIPFQGHSRIEFCRNQSRAAPSPEAYNLVVPDLPRKSSSSSNTSSEVGVPRQNLQKSGTRHQLLSTWAEAGIERSKKTIIKEESSTQAGSKEAEMGRSGNSGFPPRHSFVALPGWEGILRRHIRGNLFDTKLSFLEAHLDSLQRDDC